MTRRVDGCKRRMKKSQAVSLQLLASSPSLAVSLVSRELVGRNVSIEAQGRQKRVFEMMMSSRGTWLRHVEEKAKENAGV